MVLGPGTSRNRVLFPGTVSGVSGGPHSGGLPSRPGWDVVGWEVVRVRTCDVRSVGRSTTGVVGWVQKEDESVVVRRTNVRFEV